ncbi:MAG TPA: biotin--[acetyl-CoA-carboxylase] ligase [Gemmataceae bacterium]|nr:biotin--[acetyl-CoA-carboxylase] ligase [Gemmataceae bacterium]
MHPLEEWKLPTKHVGRQVLVFAQMDSTNSYAAGLGNDPANSGIVVIAHEQSAGRGQHGRTWQCPSGMGVLMSVLLFPPPAVRRPVILAALAANAACETIRRTTDLQARIKWPNDVLLRGRKVCGILIEQTGPTVMGIGLNVLQPESVFENAGLPVAASLEMFAGKSLNRDEIARQLIQELDEQYGQIVDGNLDKLESAWKWRMGLLGKQVEVECVDQLVHGRLDDLSFDRIAINPIGGFPLLILPERIKHITEQV